MTSLKVVPTSVTRMANVLRMRRLVFGNVLAVLDGKELSVNKLQNKIAQTRLTMTEVSTEQGLISDSKLDYNKFGWRFYNNSDFKAEIVLSISLLIYFKSLID